MNVGPDPSGDDHAPRRPASEAELGFKKTKAVRWFDPGVLLSTGLKVLMSSTFGAYLDKRELQEVLYELDGFLDYSSQDDSWIDYVADLGDGFDATYSIARLLARPRLSVSSAEGDLLLPRGQLLVMGGDQVYPAATPDDYENRLVGPYRAALPWVGNNVAPDVLALPGNHDWYDGLTNFIRLFCQDRWIGGWKTRQKRSYFAVRLPHRWWLWGIDISFDAYIDEPQLDYFRGLATGHVRKGDRVILCTAKPSWVKASKQPRSLENLLFFEREVLESSGATLAVVIAGDLHHYSRYESDRRHWITAGGGGAFLHPTHHLEPSLRLNYAQDKELTATLREHAYPPKRKSRWLSFGSIVFAARNPRFVLLPAFLYGIGGWLIASPLRAGTDSFGTRFASAEVADVWGGFLRSPSALIFFGVLLLALVGFCDARPKTRRWALGACHAVAHMGATFLLVSLSGALLAGASGVWVSVLFVAWMTGLGGVVGSLIVGTYLAVCVAWLRCHATEAFSAQRLQAYKSFVRFHVGSDGTLSIYAIGLRKSIRKWRLDPDGPPDGPWFRSDHPLQPTLIEGPIRVPDGSRGRDSATRKRVR